MKALLQRPGPWVVITLVLVAIAAALLRARGPKVSVVQARAQGLEQHLVASGRIRVPTRISIASQVPGLALVVAVLEGQRVRAGELLVQLDDAEARAGLAQAQAAVDQASARVAQLRKVGAIVATQLYLQAETNLDQAKADHARAVELAQSGALARVQLDDAARRVQLASAQKSAAEAQQLSAAPQGADSRLALSALLQAQAQLSAAQARLQQTRISAPQPGLVLSREIEPGNVVQPGTVLLTLAADSGTELVIHPDERNLATLRIGQMARASADAFPSDVFDAEIHYVAPAVDPQRGSVEVRLRVPHPPAGLRPDMTVSVDLTVASVAHALTLPSDAIRGIATDTPSVWTVGDGRVHVQRIQLGIRGEDRCQVLGGVDERSLVVHPALPGLSPGQRVRVEREDP